MSSTVRLFRRQSTEEMSYVVDVIKYYFKEDLFGVDLVTDQFQQSGDTEVYLIIFEKYYMRNGSMSNLTIQLIKNGQTQSAIVVGSGGGTGILNISRGANSEFADECAFVLKDLGFVEIHD